MRLKLASRLVLTIWGPKPKIKDGALFVGLSQGEPKYKGPLKFANFRRPKVAAAPQDLAQCRL